MHLVGSHGAERPRIGSIVTDQAGNQVDRQQDGEYEKTLAEPKDNLTADGLSFMRFLTGLWQADVPY